MAVRTHLRLGDILVREGLLTDAQLQEAIGVQKNSGKRLGETLVSMKFVTEEQLAEVLGRQLGIPYRRFSKGELTQQADPAVKGILPQDVIRKDMVLPLVKNQNSLTIATVDPLDLILFDNLKRMTGCQINPVITTRSDLAAAIEATYGKLDLLKQAVAGSYGETTEGQGGAKVETVEDISLSDTPPGGADDVTSQAGQAQVVRLVDLFLMEAVKSRASDIHIEPFINRISIRFRIDGVLQPVDPPAAHLMAAIISRIKILSKMDISEKRLPQDGGFTIKIAEKTVDLRVSTIPVIYGEKVVIRLLDKSNLVADLKLLGLESKALEDYQRGITAPYGLIFITGPTGSGKSTTLYTTLAKLKSPAKNLITIEDPVEYKMEGINQVQAKPQIGLTFAAGLRAFLRQDPDIIMLGEVRDLETAEICVRAALTGHLVLSTLHTNDASSAVTRLMDLGIEPALLSPSLIMVIAQRLVRKLCAECKEPYDPPAAIREKINLPAGQYCRPKGCPACRNTGYKGRSAIYEVLIVDDAIREGVLKRASAQEIKQLARKNGMKTLVESGIDKAAAGVTSLEEAFSVTVGEL